MPVFKDTAGVQLEEQVRGLFLGLSVADVMAGQGEEICMMGKAGLRATQNPREAGEW